MILRLFCCLTLLSISANLLAQAEMNIKYKMEKNEIYRVIPEEPKEYTACNIAARAIDGLGFRYYWASEGLREEDLNYKPSEDGRTCLQTLEHIHGLARAVHNAVFQIANERSNLNDSIGYEEMRNETLSFLSKASEKLKNSSDDQMQNMEVIFRRGEQESRFPFWNLINGQLEDAVWHCGQLVSFRRASGNPFDSNANVFRGTYRER